MHYVFSIDIRSVNITLPQKIIFSKMFVFQIITVYQNNIKLFYEINIFQRNKKKIGRMTKKKRFYKL